MKNECPTCNGFGELMQMVCYGDMPIEKKEICTDCDGLGYISNALLAEDAAHGKEE